MFSLWSWETGCCLAYCVCSVLSQGPRGPSSQVLAPVGSTLGHLASSVASSPVATVSAQSLCSECAGVGVGRQGEGSLWKARKLIFMPQALVPRGTAGSICGQAWRGGWEEPSSAREEGQDQKGPLGEQRGGTKMLSIREPASSVSRHSWGVEMRHHPLSPQPTRT